MRFVSISLVLSVVVLLSSGCASRWYVDPPTVLETSGPLGIDVETFNGDVIIDVDDRRKEATVTIVREAVHGYLRQKEATASLAEIRYTIDLVPGDLGPVLEIRTWTEHPEPHFQRAHVHIEVPAVDGVIVRTRHGQVAARGIQGAVDISTTDGDVRVMTNRAMLEPVTIVSQGGHIEYRVRGESTAAFDCQTIGGKVNHHVRYGRFVIGSGRDPAKLVATLNDGANPVVLRTVDGDIRIAVVHNPEQAGDLLLGP